MENNCHKVKYGSKEEAEVALRQIRKRFKNGTGPVHSYLCHCGAWHLTSQYQVRNETNEMHNIIHSLHEQIHKLKNENNLLKTETNKELFRVLKKDELVKELRKELEAKNKKIHDLKEDISKLIYKLMQAQNKTAA